MFPNVARYAVDLGASYGKPPFWPIGLVLILVLVLYGISHAHSDRNPDNGLVQEYDPICCDERDCSPIDPSRVQLVADGWLLDGKWLVPWGKQIPSTDGRWHACITTSDNDADQWLPHDGKGRLCLYVPPQGV